MSIRNMPLNATVFGIDIGKNVFHVVGLDGSGTPIQRATLRRDTLLQFFGRAVSTTVGMRHAPVHNGLHASLRRSATRLALSRLSS
jgi:hypothetical protein